MADASPPRATPSDAGSDSARSSASAEPRPVSATDNADVNRPAKRARPDDEADGESETRAPPSPRRKPAPPTPLPPTLFGEAVVPDIHREVLDFVYGILQANAHVLESRPHAAVEVEAKLGRLVDKRTGRRLDLPVSCETVVRLPAGVVRFESDMSMPQHRHFNGVLNQLVERRVLAYTHTREIDRFHAVGTRQGDRVRVTTDALAGTPLATIRKTRLDSIDVFVPRAPLDYRVSVSLEEPVDASTALGHADTRERHKDRISYRHRLVQVDLTQVQSLPVGTPWGSPAAVAASKTGDGVSHELEVEFVDAASSILAEKRALDAGKPSKFQENVVHLVNNVRMLADKARRM
ncbi:mRNA-capping enzyme subunit beta [Blastocladiella emersonii ATCC 22665]|nr:mRNA-capping enzyme subunit beta [Blastocladiella emersonii ATCC 22665]